MINNTLLNNSSNDYNIFLMIKKEMKNGELYIQDLTSKNRSVLHQICAKYGLEHYSTGNYANRIFVIKDNTHTYFSNTTPEDYWYYVYKNNIVNNKLTNNKLTDNEKIDNEKIDNEEIDNEQIYDDDDDNNEIDDEEIDDDDDEIDDDDDDDDDKDSEDSEDSDTYTNESSDSVSNYTGTDLTFYKKLNNQEKMLKCLYFVSVSNLLVNILIMYNM